MEDRISKIERDMAVVSSSMANISKTLEKMSEVHLEGRLLTERVSIMDRELVDSFKRMNDRIDEEKSARTWLTKVMLVGLTSIVIESVYRHAPLLNS